MPQAIYRKDYQVSDYLIKTTQLRFELFEDKTLVHSEILFYKNPLSNNKNADLLLNGEQLKLLSITKNNQHIEYQLSDKGLKIANLEYEFSLEISTEIYPQKNTSLNGLYQSSGNFCTQCEAQGFRQITYYLDRPDVLSVFSVSIVADKQKYPVLLSNGNLIKHDDNSVLWHDPHPKPCYLFALVAGYFAVLSDTYTTTENTEVALKIYTQPHNAHKTTFAMSALKKSFKWEEDRFNLAYDLDTYMIVAVDDFNMGAMENKSLNIFNSKYVLGDVSTATDEDFIDIEAVIGHEYFHNWTGNRITCRDWFQLSLKEGLTVFRDQEFTADCYDRGIKRIDDVARLKSHQFAEDAGAMSHPVRPESYLEMNNFYTATVYEKGAELVRMLHTLLGETGFQTGMSLYVQRHDGQAVTIDDFVCVMADANQKDLSQFMLWYQQSGTPKVTINGKYNTKNQTFTISINQLGKNFLMPFAYALFDKSGNKTHEDVFELNKSQHEITIKNLTQAPIASYFRGFSAPIIQINNNTIADKIHLLTAEDDGFSTWENAQDLWLHLLLNQPSQSEKTQIFTAFANSLKNQQNTALLARLLTLPSEQYIAQQVTEIDALAIFTKRHQLAIDFATQYQDDLLAKYQTLFTQQSSDFTVESIANRALKNTCLRLLVLLDKEIYYQLGQIQFTTAKTMTDKFGALQTLSYQKNPYRTKVMTDFYSQYENDDLVVEKWFSLQAHAQDADIKQIKTLMQHPKFSLTNPNRLRSLIGAWSANHQFHTPDGYDLLTNIIIKLNLTNPQIGARLCGAFNHHQKYTTSQGDAQRAALEKILATKNLSNDILEIVQTALQKQ